MENRREQYSFSTSGAAAIRLCDQRQDMLTMHLAAKEIAAEAEDRVLAHDRLALMALDAQDGDAPAA